MRPIKLALAVAVFLAVAAVPVTARQEQQQASPPEIGAMAPDFELPAATRYGILREPVKLSDFRGKTVVLAFFFRARTRG